MLCFAIALPTLARAGVFSGNEKFLFRQELVVAEGAQSMPLLAASLAVDDVPAKGGGSIVAYDGVLIPDASGQFAEKSGEQQIVGEISTYTVREGDTLSQIATMFGVSGSTILWANDIKNANLIKPGMTLVILPISGVRHTVGKGDTLASIVKKYTGDLNEVLAYNDITEGDLTVGSIIVIPNGVVPVPVTPKAKPKSGVIASGSGSSGFMHPVPGSRRTQGIHGYNGVDLAAPVGTPVRAAAAGTVVVSRPSGYNGGYGQYIVIKHANGVQTLYAHLSQNNVGVGESVGAGENIGLVGNTGRSTGPHTHFEVRGAKNPF